MSYHKHIWKRKALQNMIDNSGKVFQWLAMSWTFNLRTTQCLSNSDFPGVAMNCQQAVEFSAKALLLAFGASPQKTHDSSGQLKRLIETGVNEGLVLELVSIVSELAEEYLPARYPDIESPFDIYDLDEAKELQRFSRRGQMLALMLIERRLSLSQNDVIRDALAEIHEETLRRAVEKELGHLTAGEDE